MHLNTQISLALPHHKQYYSGYELLGLCIVFINKDEGILPVAVDFVF